MFLGMSKGLEYYPATRPVEFLMEALIKIFEERASPISPSEKIPFVTENKLRDFFVMP